jgi:hypothetical protein
MPTPTLMEQPQVAAEAVVGKEVTGGATPTREQELAAKLRDEVAKDIPARQILDGIRPHPAPNPGEVHNLNNENIGTKRFDTGPNAGEKDYSTEPRSEELRKRADVASRIARELLDKGFDDIKDDDATNPDIRDPKTAVQKKQILSEACQRAIESWPQGKAIFDGLNPAEKQAKIEELFLKNPHALKALSQEFADVYNQGKISKDLLSVAEDEFAKAEKINKAKEEALTALKDRLQKIEDGEKKFLPGTNEYNDLIRLRGLASGWEAALRSKQTEIEQLTQSVNAAYPRAEVHTFDEADTVDPNTQKVLHRKTPVQTPNQGVIQQIAQAEARMRVLRSEMNQIQTDQGTLRGYEDEINRLNKERNDLKTAEVPLIEESAKAELDFKTAKRNLDVQRAARAVDEEKFVNNVEGMFQEAATKFLETEVKRYEAAQAKLAAKATETAQTADEKHIYGAMEKKYRVEKKGKRTKINGKEVKTDYNKMLAERNVDWLVKDFMEQSILEIRNKTGVTGSPEELEERKRLDEKYKDTDYMKRMGAVVTERLLRNYFEAGGKPEDGDIRVLSETDWGIAAIDNAISKNEEAQKVIDRLKGPSNKSTGEVIRGLMKNPTTYKVGVSLLALLFGAPFLAIAASGAYAAYAAAGHAVGAPGGPLF